MSELKLTHDLNRLIADATVFYQKLRHYHWNVHGPGFFVLHGEFERLYTAWEDVIDELAERVRTLGSTPIHTLADVLAEARLEEDAGVPDAHAMVRRVAGDLEALHAHITDVLDDAHANSRGTADLLGDVLDRIEKDLWMLGAWLRPGGTSAETSGTRRSHDLQMG